MLNFLFLHYQFYTAKINESNLVAFHLTEFSVFLFILDSMIMICELIETIMKFAISLSD